MEDKKAEFLALYRTLITRAGSNDLLEWLEQSDFFIAPASTRFHGSHEGGLLEHSLNVYKCLLSLIEGAGINGEYSDESVAIVSLLHDVCKTNFYKKGFRNVKEDGRWVQKEVYEIDERFPCGHSEKSVILLQNFIKLSGDEIYAIRAHMGGFDASVKGGDYFVGKIFEKSKLALLTHMADLEATYLLETGEAKLSQHVKMNGQEV